jgi:hypothetical protein
VATSSFVEWCGGHASLSPAPAYGAYPPTEGIGLAWEAISSLVAVMASDVCQGRGSFL